MRSAAVLGTISLFLAVWTVSFTDAQPSVVVTKKCEYATDVSMTITVGTNDSSILKFVATEGNFMSGCTSTTVDGFEQLTIITDPAGVQTTPDPTMKDCYVAVTGTEITVIVAALKDHELYAVHELVVDYEITCDTVGSSGTTEIVLSADKGTPITRGIAVSDDGVVASLLDDTGAAIAAGAVLSLGDKVKMRLAFDRNTAVGAPLGLQVLEVEVSSTQDFSVKVSMLVAGCLPSPARQGFYFASNFVATVTAAEDLATFITESGLASIARFLNTLGVDIQVLYFRITYLIGCPDLLDTDTCYNQDTLCTTRKRRSADEAPKSNTTMTLSVQVDVSGINGKSSKSAIEGDKPAAGGNTETECFMAYSFWIVALVLGILLLLVIFLAMFLFYRVRREQSKQDQYLESTGTQNMAYSK